MDKKLSESKPKNRKQQELDEEISSDSDEDIASDDNQTRKRKAEEVSGSESEEETAQEKKLRLAKKYLESIEAEERLKNDSEDVDHKTIGNRLRDDILDQSGRLHKKVADNYVGANFDAICCLKNGHDSSVTCVVITSDQKFVFSAAKDCSIVKWDLENNKRVHTIKGVIKKSKKRNKTKQNKSGDEPKAKSVGHSGHIISMAISSDDKFLATGCVDKKINVWNPKTMELLKTFTGHRGPVSGLAFRKDHHQLFSGSFDRSVKVWNLDEMGYVETLFGHQDSILAVDSYIRDRAITCGARDSTVRIWKIVEESQLVFHGSNQSIDCVKFIDEQHFVTGDDNGFVMKNVFLSVFRFLLWYCLNTKQSHMSLECDEEEAVDNLSDRSRNGRQYCQLGDSAGGPPQHRSDCFRFLRWIRPFMEVFR